MIRLIKIIVLLFHKFGFRFIYLLIPVYRFFYKILYWLGIAADLIFFNRYRRIKIKKPVFLVGHPRSGTTFLHKFIIKNCTEFEGMYLYRMIFSTLTSRIIVKPFLNTINKLFPTNLYDPKIHKTGFLEPETDDAVLFFKDFDGMFSWLYFSALNKYESFENLEKDLIITSKSSYVLKNLKTVFKKNLFRNSSKRIFSKSFSLVLNLDEIKKVFPGAKIVILIRDPLEAIPSSFSLARNVQMNLNKFENLTLEERNSYYRNLYMASIIFYKKLINHLESKEIRENDLLVINYKDFTSNFEDVMNRIITFCEIEKTSKLLDAINTQALKQPNYKGQHVYTLEEFGFIKDEVIRDFDFVYKKFSFRNIN